jgi:Tol biopolymer transport system component
MIDEHQVREMLHRRADAVVTIVVDAPKAARRARRRLLANGAVAMLAAAAIVVATFAGVDAIRSAPVPADLPTPSPAPGVLRADAEVLSFTGRALVAVNPETGKQRVLVKDLGVVWAAEWSADGRWVAYEMPSEGPDDFFGPISLWVVGPSQEPRQVATGVKRRVGHGGPSGTWMWSPTGPELATIDGSTLSIIDPGTGETHTVGSIPGGVTAWPAWSPDRTRFVFGARGGALYSIDARSGARSLLVRLPGAHLDSVDQIEWSPDGAHIAVMNDLSLSGGRVYVIDADGSNVRVLADDVDPAAGKDWFTNPMVAWSGDGTRLAYPQWGPDGKLRIRVAPMDGSAPAEIGSPSAACGSRDPDCETQLTWSPDGSQIALRLRSAGDGSVVTSAIDADGSGDAEPIDELTYRSWDGGWYSCCG